MVVARELLDFPSAVFMLSIGLVAPLGVAKTATACGLNVVADLAPAGRPAITRLERVRLQERMRLLQLL